MAIKIVLVETAIFRGMSKTISDAQTIDATSGTSPVTEALRALDGSTSLVVAPTALRGQSCFEAALNAVGGSLSVAYFAGMDEFKANIESVKAFAAEGRTTGVKSFLEKGSTIYSQAFFNAGGVGAKLDPCFTFAHGKLSPKRAVDAWGALNSLVFLAIGSLPDQGEKGTGERVDVQVGADSKRFVFSVRFDCHAGLAESFRKSSLLEVTRAACDVYELRAIASGGKIEVTGVIQIGNETPQRVELHTAQPAAGLESNESVKEYEFKDFGSLAGTKAEEKRVVKGGFKKKFSEQVKVSAPESAPDNVVNIKGDAPNAQQKVVVSGSASLGKEQKVVVSGSAGLGKEAEKTVVSSNTTALGKSPENFAAAAAEAQAKEKSAALYESKIQGLEATLRQREELVAKLNKEIEEIKDPMKMGVITGIKDNQLEGLKANITRLQTEVEEAAKREKELMAVVDKAIGLKDEAVKRLKEYETKLRQASGGTNSKTQMLEKALEEQKRQNKELSKKITQLMEQIQKAA